MQQQAAVPATEPGSGSDQAADTDKDDTLQLLFCVVGLLTTLVVYGICQERIVTIPYGPNGEHFTHTMLLVLCNRLLTVVVAGGAMLVCGEGLSSDAPHVQYGKVSVANIASTACQFESLRYVSFPLHTLVKSSKMLPVMLWGSVILKKQYKTVDYSSALLVIVGVTAFILQGDVTQAKQKFSEAGPGLFSFSDSGLGATLLLSHLGFDGFASTFQAKLFRDYNMSFAALTFYTTAWSSVLSFAGLVARGGLGSSLAFLAKHPDCTLDIFYLAMAATLSQLLISLTIRRHGPLVFAIVQTLRQLVSILLSCLIFSHSLAWGQIVAVVVVFAALSWRIAARKEGKSAPSAERPPTSNPKLDPGNLADKQLQSSSKVDVDAESGLTRAKADAEHGAQHWDNCAEPAGSEPARMTPPDRGHRVCAFGHTGIVVGISERLDARVGISARLRLFS